METVRIGLLGLGTIGSAVAAQLVTNAQHYQALTRQRWELTWVAVAHPNRPRTVKLPVTTRVTTDWRQVVTDPAVDVVIELIGGTGVAQAAVTTALRHGKLVITANKDLMATAGPALEKLAHQSGGRVGFEGSVAGGIPILQLLTTALATDQIQAISGVLNGTSNYILSQLEQTGSELAPALAQAQAQGYAESDPSKDLNGLDAAYKLTILIRLAFHQVVNPAALAVTGITALSPQLLNAARQWGLKIRLLARAQRRDQRLLAEVAPVAIGPQSVFYGLDGVDNAVALTSERLGQTVYQGPGAGGLATANSILSDLYRLTSARGTSFTPAVPGRVYPLAQAPRTYLAVSAASLPLGGPWQKRQAGSALTRPLTASQQAAWAQRLPQVAWLPVSAISG